MNRLSSEPVGIVRSYQVMSCRGTYGNSYQRLLMFTTARRKAPAGLLQIVLARYEHWRRDRAASVAFDDLRREPARPGDCVTITITIPAEPPHARRRDAISEPRTSATRARGARRP
jgi:hypothetical protein